MNDRAPGAATAPVAVWVAAIVAAAALAYGPAYGAGFVWDDDDYLTENPLVRGEEGGLGAIWLTTRTPQYYPLVFTTFWLEHRLWGLDPLGYHVVNVGLHALNAVLAGLVLRALRVPYGWWVALLFAVHPVHVESVAWITERKNVLSGALYLVALLLYLRFDRHGRRRDYAASMASFALALLSKTVVSSLPVVLGLAILHLRGRVTRRDALRIAPFAALALGLGLVTVRLEREMVEAVPFDFALAWWERVLVALRALWFYPAKLLLPHPLIFNYPRWPLDGSGALASAAALAVAGALLGALWRRGRRGPALAASWYAITIAPALGFFDVYPFRYSFVADHFQYLASLGILVLVVQAAVHAVRPAVRRGLPVAAVPAAGLCVAALLGTLTWNHARAFRDEEALWTDTLRKNPGSWIAHNNLGAMLLRHGDPSGALARFEAAIGCKPTAAESWTGRGMALGRLGRIDEALAALDRAVELDPRYPHSRLERGELLSRTGRHDAAIDDLSRFLAANPDHVPALRARALAFAASRRLEAALADIDRAIELGASAEAYNDRGAVRLQLGLGEEALRDFTRAIESRPDEPRFRTNRGLAQSRLGRADEACAEWEQACALGDCRAFDARCAAAPAP